LVFMSLSICAELILRLLYCSVYLFVSICFCTLTCVNKGHI